MSKGIVAVGMSGGVDSSVAALMLKEQGYEVMGVTMQIWENDGKEHKVTQHACYGPGEDEEIAEAQEIASRFGLAHHVIDLKKEYKATVLDYFRDEYLSGRTPNPCIQCNCKIKFGALLDSMIAKGIRFDYFATGHYVRVEYDPVRGRHLLKRAKDLRKDQTYFLFYLRQDQLAKCLFPLGDYTKAEIKAISRERGLGLEDKPESQNFVATGYESLLEDAAKPGNIVDLQGNILGEHKGIHLFTVGQRKKLGIASDAPLYVVKIDAASHTVIVGRKDDIYSSHLTASQLNWIAIDKLTGPIEVSTKIRYVQNEELALVEPLDDTTVKVSFRTPQMAVTPGQAVVFYDDDVVVGGGIIQ